MNSKLFKWVMEYEFKSFYTSEQDWQRDFKQFCELFAKKRAELIA